MLFTDQTKVSKFSAVEPGNLVILLGHSPAATPALVVKDAEGGRWAVGLSPELDRHQRADDDPVLDLGKSSVRFDYSSALALDVTVPPEGSLLFLKGRIAIFEKPGKITGRGSAIGLDGSYGLVYRDQNVPAFARCQIGVMRGEHFDVVVELGAD